jgi:GDPmannose 4,6-dehydratase
MLQQDEPDDYVIATGETHSVREFLEESFSYAGLDWQKYTEFDPWYYRPAEVDLLVGDATKARKTFGWEAKIRFKELIHLMVDADIGMVGTQTHRDVSHDRDRSEIRNPRLRVVP